MMTKRELIEALEKSAAPDARVVIWVDGYWDDINDVPDTVDKDGWLNLNNSEFTYV